MISIGPSYDKGVPQDRELGMTVGVSREIEREGIPGGKCGKRKKDATTKLFI